MTFRRSKFNWQRRSAEYLDQCKSLGEKNHYRDAYLACAKATNEDPHNEQANSLKDQMLASLRRDMKTLDEDSVLEETLGNVESAKEKWQKNIQDDLRILMNYSKKSKVLLKKYGS